MAPQAASVETGCLYFVEALLFSRGLLCPLVFTWILLIDDR